MNIKKTLLALAVSTVATAAFGDVVVNITGSTAFRDIAYDVVANKLTNYTSVAVSNGASGIRTYRGTYNFGSVATPNNQTLQVNFSFTGSVEGIDSLNNGTTVLTAGNTNVVADATFSDVFPETAGRDKTAFGANIYQVGVVPYVFFSASANNIVNNSVNFTNTLSYATNLTQRQAATVYGSGGAIAVSFLTGNSAHTDTLYTVGRYPGSGTRATVEAVIYNSALNSNYYFDLRSTNNTPTPFGTDDTYETKAGGLQGSSDVPAYVLSGTSIAGFYSGGTLGNHVKVFPNGLGYISTGDLPTSGVKALAYEGVTESKANVANGSYPLWSYEHLIYRATGGPSGNVLTIINKIRDILKSDTYQTNSSAVYYTKGFVPQSAMTVNRTIDGGPINLN